MSSRVTKRPRRSSALLVDPSFPAAQVDSKSTLKQDVAAQNEAAFDALRDSQARLASELVDMMHLQDISMQFIQEDSPADLYHQILDAAIALLHSDMGTIQEFDSEKRELRMLACRGFASESVAFWQRVSTTSGTSFSVALSKRERVIVPDIETCDFMVGTVDLEQYRTSGIRSMQSTPLRARNGRLVGILSTQWHQPHQPSERELRLLDVLARQAADLIERARVEAQRETALASLQEARQDLEQRVVERTAELTEVNQKLLESDSMLRYQAIILSHITDAVIATDKDRLITYINPAAEQQYGWKAEEAIGRNPVHLFQAEFLDTTDLAFAQQVESEGLWRGEVIVHRKDGTSFYAEATAMALRDESGQLIGHIGVHHDISKRKRAEAELRASQEQLREYSRRLVEAIENEQRNLARELHDQAGQSLSALKLILGKLRRDVNSGLSHTSHFDMIGQLIEHVMDDLHRLSINLRPVSLDRYGLAIALQQYVDFYRQGSGLDVDLTAVGIEEQRLPAEIETAVYRIVQEALTNVSRHARAHHVNVTVERRPGRVVAIVEDDGQGFDLDEALRGNRLGLLGMHERAQMLDGSLKVETTPGKGTVVYAELPCASLEMPA